MSESPPLRFAFAIHLHQPVGNFDHVFEDHLEGVYRPLLRALHSHGAYPFTLHLSGPLLDWLEVHAASFLDEIGRRVSDGRIELLTSGRHEPILAALSPRDRLEQLEAMQSLLRARFGVEAAGAWLTERVWEPDLPDTLAHAGIEYALLDDRHFLACGIEREELDRAFQTESGGSALTLLPIDERLRYLIPFQPVDEIENFFASRRASGCRQLVLGDDGEKFGGWPGTRAWVYDGGWLDAFLSALGKLRARGVLEPITTGEAAAAPGGGLAYPAPGSYREMEEWTLPRPAARRFNSLVDRNSTQPPAEANRSAADDAGPLIRGGHWKGFLRKYPESNRMHKAALHLSRLCRGRGDPDEARLAIGRAQCNDAYWHGVFGGVYLPHLRQAVWKELARAERRLRKGEDIACELLDFDFDGHEEVWVHSSRASVLVAPARGGAIEMLTNFRNGANYADVMSRYLETYHGDPEAHHHDSSDGPSPPGADPLQDGVASIHHRNIEAPAPPLPDRAPLALFQELAFRPEPARLSPHIRTRRKAAPFRETASDPGPAVTPTPTAGATGGDSPTATPSGPTLAEWYLHPFRLASPPRTEAGRVHVYMESESGLPNMRKTIDIRADGAVCVTLDWSRSQLPSGALVASRIALARNAQVKGVPTALESRERIVTMTRSEQGFEHIDQGEIMQLAWPVETAKARIRLQPG